MTNIQQTVLRFAYLVGDSNQSSFNNNRSKHTFTISLAVAGKSLYSYSNQLAVTPAAGFKSFHHQCDYLGRNMLLLLQLKPQLAGINLERPSDPTRANCLTDASEVSTPSSSLGASVSGGCLGCHCGIAPLRASRLQLMQSITQVLERTWPVSHSHASLGLGGVLFTVSCCHASSGDLWSLQQHAWRRYCNHAPTPLPQCAIVVLYLYCNFCCHNRWDCMFSSESFFHNIVLLYEREITVVQ